MKFSIDSTATRAATSPAACPPMPSATTNSRRSSALTKQSSFMCRTGPVSLKPNAFTCVSWGGYGVYHAGCPGDTTLVVEGVVANGPIWDKNRKLSGQLAGKLRPRVDADFFED